jgi:hypothetical protein
VSGAIPVRGFTLAHDPSPVAFVTRVGVASGSNAAAAALACAASEPDRAALLIDLDDGRAPRSSLIATAGARELEERIAAHLPDAALASRGRICHLRLPPDPVGIEQIAAVLPLVRESAGIVHLPPVSLRPALEETRIRTTAALLRVDLAEDRALTALAVRDLIGRDLRVAVLKRPLGWVTARAALLGALPAGGEALPARLRDRLLKTEDNKFHHCYDEEDEPEGDRGETPRQERQEPTPLPRWKESRCTNKGRGRA